MLIYPTSRPPTQLVYLSYGLYMQKIQITEYRSHSKINKIYSLKGEHIQKVSDARISSGTATIIELNKFSDLMKYLREADKFTALGYGVSRHYKIKICTLASKKEDDKNFITRTKKNIKYREAPGIVMFDYDPSEYYNGGLVLTFEQWLSILIEVFPEFDGAAYIVKHSMSACVTKIGEKNRAKGFHAYFKVPNASLIPSFGKLLHEHLKAAGYGYIALSAPGYELSRSIIDHCVFDGSRLDFVGAPTVGKGLEFIEPKIEFKNGKWLDLSKLRNLTSKQLNKRDEYFKNQQRDIKPLKIAKQIAYDNQKVAEYIDLGMSEYAALAKVKKNRSNRWAVLEPDTRIYLSDGSTMLLKDIIKQRTALRFADPIKGYSHGTTTAELRFDKNHKPYIYSYAYGGVKYQIEGYVEKSFNNAPCLFKKKYEFDFFYSSLLPGEGKSYWAMEQIKKIQNRNEKYLVCLPSTHLMSEYKNKLLSQNPCAINSKGNFKNKRRRSLVSDQIKNAVADHRRVILITHNALMDCIDHDLFKEFAEYNLIIDETFLTIIYKFSQYKLKNAISEDGFINRICQAKHYEQHDVLTIRDWDQYEEFCKNSDGFDSFDTSKEVKILNSIADDTKEVWMLNMKRSKKNVLLAEIFNFQMLNYFKSRTLLGACCEETAIFSELGKVFNMKHLDMNGFERRNINYENIVIWPLTDDNYSLNSRDFYRFVSPDHSKIYDAQQYTNRVMKRLGFKQSLRISNKDDYEVADYEIDGRVYDRKKLCLSKEWVRGYVISSNCAGLNKWSHKHNLVYVAAFNFRPHITAFFKYRLPAYNLWKENNAYKAMQCIMRTSARDVDSTVVVNVIVSDYRTAIEVKEALRGEPTIRYHPLYNKFISEPLSESNKTKSVEFSKKSALKRGPKVKYTAEQKKERRRLVNAKAYAKRKL